MVAVKPWAPKLASQLVHLFCDNATALAIFHARKVSDLFLQACAKKVLLTCATWDITLTTSGYVAGESLTATTDALSCWHLGQVFRDLVSAVVKERGIRLLSVPEELVHLYKHL